MNKIIFEYVDNSTDKIINESMRLESPVAVDTHCAAEVRAFNSFLLAQGYLPETIEKYIIVENLWDDVDDCFTGTKEEYYNN